MRKRNVGTVVVVFLIDLYRFFGPGLLAFVVGGGCRQSPTCSLYTRQAILEKGLRKGILMGAKRVFLCNNFVR